MRIEITGDPIPSIDEDDSEDAFERATAFREALIDATSELRDSRAYYLDAISQVQRRPDGSAVVELYDAAANIVEWGSSGYDFRDIMLRNGERSRVVPIGGELAAKYGGPPPRFRTITNFDDGSWHYPSREGKHLIDRTLAALGEDATVTKIGIKDG